jgi:2-oxoglutarate ferredoxin oxidoreductase subunit alpha
MTVDISIRICGQAGQGVQSISSAMGKVLIRHGYDVFINNDVESRIRGGHNFDQIRISHQPVHAVNDKIDLMIALDAETRDVDLPHLKDDGVMVYNGEKAETDSKNPHHIPIPLEELASRAGGSKIMANTVATGAAFALLKFELQPLLDHLKAVFKDKGKAVVDQNQTCAESGYRYVQQQFKGDFPYEIKAGEFRKERMLINGSQAMALGAICSGLKFYSGYPMSPSTGIMETVAAMAKEHRIIMEPAEDEISAINMAIGASFAGARAMTATSGGGFCLMVEALGLAGMTETPVVVINAQRPGPSTGLPTRTEQADLNFVIHAGHGEYPRAVLAPGNAEQAFYAMGKAFNLADKYQTPVIVLGDQHLNDSFFTVDAFDMDNMMIERGEIVGDKDIPKLKDYKRYAIKGSGISPRILPGLTEAVLYADSDEHTEAGHITESAEARNRQHEKRMAKLKGLRKEMKAPEIYPSQKGDIVLLGWGSTHGVLKETVDQMNSQDMNARLIHFREVYPFPGCDFSEMIDGHTKIISVENNYSGQFADFFSHETGLSISQKILKFDGRPFTAHEIISAVKERI